MAVMEVSVRMNGRLGSFKSNFLTLQLQGQRIEAAHICPSLNLSRVNSVFVSGLMGPSTMPIIKLWTVTTSTTT